MFYKKILKDFTFFFFTLFVITSTFSIAAAQASLGLSLLLFIAYIITGKKNPFNIELKYFYIPVLLYVGWLIVSALFTQDPLKSISIIKEEWLFLAVPIGIFLFSVESYRKKIIIAFAGACGLVAVYGIVQHFTGIHWFKDTPPYDAFLYGFRVKGFFSHRLTFGNYFATASMLIFSYYIYSFKRMNKNEKLFFGSVSALSIIVTFLSHSYGPILATILTLCLLLLLLKNKIGYAILTIIIAVVISVLVFIPRTSDRIKSKIGIEMNIENRVSRAFIWSNSFRMVKENPVVGVGQGNFYDTFQQYEPEKRVHVHAHNDLLNIAAISGIPGMIFFALIWISIFWTMGKALLYGNELYRPLFAAALFGSSAFFLSSLTEATFADEEVRQMLMFVWSIGLSACILSKKAESGT